LKLLKPGRFILSCLQEIQKDLDEREIRIKLQIYPSTSWGVPNKQTIIGVPWWYYIDNLLNEDGIGLCNKEPVIQFLRHETGHIINYSFKLYQEPQWKDVFGNFNEKYIYPPKDCSKKDQLKYCYYLKEYTNKKLHPDEQFAETFGVVTDSGLKGLVSLWKSLTNQTQRLIKYNYVKETLEYLRNKEPLVVSKKLDKPVGRITIT